MKYVPLEFCLSALFASALSLTAADNWPQWRGPLCTGVAPDANPPTTWSETSNVKWKVKIPGDGTSTPLVWGNKVFVQTAIPAAKSAQSANSSASESSPDPGASGARNVAPPPPPPPGGPPGPPPGGDPPGPGERFGARGGPGGGGRGGMGGAAPNQPYDFALLCLDRGTGKTLWQKTAREQVPHEGVRDGDCSFAATSGVTDGEHVYVFFGSRGLYCYGFDGSLVWTQDFGRMRIKNGFGEGSSPALFKDTLVVNWDHEDGSFITALDKKTGKALWKEQREEATTWSTPLIVEHGGTAQVITSGSRKIRSYDLATGKLLWECKGLTANVIPSPVADGEKVYCMSGFGGSALDAMRLDAMGDITGTDAIVWTHNQGTPYVPSPLLYNGKLYFFRVNNPRLTCLDAATGKAFFDAEQVEGLGGMVYSSPMGAAGKIYLTDRNGTTVVLKEADQLQVLATNKLDDHIDASPLAVGKELFLRGRRYLYCVCEAK